MELFCERIDVELGSKYASGFSYHLCRVFLRENIEFFHSFFHTTFYYFFILLVFFTYNI